MCAVFVCSTFPSNLRAVFRPLQCKSGYIGPTQGRLHGISIIFKHIQLIKNEAQTK